MNVEIDQSGKIEETNRDAILAFSNSQKYSAKITARTKRQLQDTFRRIGQPRTFVIATFAAAIYLLVKNDLKKVQEIVIDLEYPGYETLIAKIVRSMMEQKAMKLFPEIHFSLLGEKSNAHKLAIKIFRKKRMADRVFSFDVLARECFRYKNGRPALKYPVAKGDQ